MFLIQTLYYIISCHWISTITHEYFTQQFINTIFPAIQDHSVKNCHLNFRCLVSNFILCIMKFNKKYFIPISMEELNRKLALILGSNVNYQFTVHDNNQYQIMSLTLEDSLNNRFWVVGRSILSNKKICLLKIVWLDTISFFFISPLDPLLFLS